MIDRKGLEARIDRLGVLAYGLAREQALWHEMLRKEQQSPLSDAEREEYLTAIRRATRAVSEAQLVLGRVCRRPERT